MLNNREKDAVVFVVVASAAVCPESDSITAFFSPFTPFAGKILAKNKGHGSISLVKAGALIEAIEKPVWFVV